MSVFRSARIFADRGVLLLSRRGMATEKQLKERMMGTRNIEKITKSMKMVSAAKLRGDQMRLAAATPFARWAAAVTGEDKELESWDVAELPKKNLFIILTTDKGLCGGVNSILTRTLKSKLNMIRSEGKDFDMVVVGDKGRSQLRRSHGDHILVSAADRATPYNFELASALAQDALNGEYDQIHLVYNKFISAIAYTTSVKTISPLLDPAAEYLYDFEVEPEKDPETLQSFYEYTLGTQLYHAMMENATSEQSSRMNAMENASKNAGEMIDSLNLQYNRARQARITTELIEIISGASALKG